MSCYVYVMYVMFMLCYVCYVYVYVYVMYVHTLYYTLTFINSHLHSLDGERPSGRLPRQHHAIGAVQNRCN